MSPNEWSAGEGQDHDDRRGDPQTIGDATAEVREATEAADQRMEEVVESVEHRVNETLHRPS